jgi:pimeloyl-ACP methyl ester carboxylesterase
MTEIRGETVVILHGIAHSRWNMLGVERFLRRRGYDTLNLSYPSRKNDIAALGGFLRERLEAGGVWRRAKRVHFVAHSMGGLVTRSYLEQDRSQIPRGTLGRVVLLGSPSGGSEVADLLHRLAPYKWFYGTAGQELTTVRNADAPAPYYELGVIAGTTGWPNIAADLLFRDRHDGRVSVARTRVAGMKDHITISATHSLIAWQAKTHRQIAAFIETGMFAREARGGGGGT